ncbi:unnamed protein product, partial [Amoebophrya sp. A25]
KSVAQVLAITAARGGKNLQQLDKIPNTKMNRHRCESDVDSSLRKGSQPHSLDA